MNQLLGADRQAMLRFLWHYGEYVMAWQAVPTILRPKTKMHQHPYGFWYGEHTNTTATFRFVTHLTTDLRFLVLT